MKKAIGQTVRDIKRGVNKKVLKVPSIEQKVLDATSNEPWGPHGSLLGDIAHASRNYPEYQMIMAVIWKRINDTGKNWRHVYKALILLEYLVAYGSERVIDEIKEHSYQISTLSDFQYIDSSARDQGNNVRRKSQALVVLVNDKERIEEARQKAAANRDKFRSPSSTGGMYKPGSYGDRYDEDRYSYDREREGSYRDDDRYSRNGDDRYSRDSDECSGRDNYRYDDHRGRSRSVDHYQYGSRSRSADRDRDYDDDGQYSSRGNARADSQSQDGRPPLERKYSEQNIGAPPSYETAVNDAQSPVHKDRDGEYSAASPPKPSSSPPATNAQNQSTINSAASPVKEVESFDEFDPRNPAAAAPQPTSSSAETDLLGSLSDAFSSNALTIMPAEADTPANSGPEPTSATAPQTASSPFDDPFGDSPFKAVLSTNNEPSHQEFTSAPTFQGTPNQIVADISQSVAAVDAATNLGFSDMLPGLTYAPTSLSNAQIPSENTQYFLQEAAAQDEDTDILAGILPPSGPSPSIASQEAFPVPSGQPIPSGPSLSMNQQVSSSFPAGQPAQPNANVYGSFTVSTPVSPHMFPQTQADAQYYNSSLPAQSASVAPMASQIAPQPPTGAMPQQSNMLPGSFIPQSEHDPIASQQLTSSVDSLALVPKPAADKFDPKSTVWADTLSRGLVNLNISGAKINPLNDIGIDFEAINRKEKRMEKPAATSVTSNVTMGKAMGSGSGLGRAGAGAIRGPLNPMAGPAAGMGMGGMSSGPGMAGMGIGMAGMGMSASPGMGMSGGPGMGMGGPGMGGMGMGGGPAVGMGIGMAMNGMGGMGMGGGPGAGMGMGGYGGMNQQSMGIVMGQGVAAHMQQPAGLPPGSSMPEGYNPVMGSGYGAQQPYNGSHQPYNGCYR